MTKRQLPYIRQEPLNFQQLIEESLKLKVLNISELSPMCFEIVLSQNQTIRVEIGNIIICSACHSKDQCPHSIYILHKIFKRNLNGDYLLWQKSYTTNELQEMINERNSNGFNNPNHYYFKRSAKKTNKKCVERKDLRIDVICPICHEEFKKDDCITFCKENCGSNFHTQCLINWCQQQNSKHKNSNSCPICRITFDKYIIPDLEQEMEDHESQFLIDTQSQCSSCNNKKPIKGTQYQCIFCEDFILCEHCYPSRIHEHDAYLKRYKINSQWLPVFKNQDQKMIQCDMIREIFNQSNLAKNELINFLISNYPDPFTYDSPKLSKNHNNYYRKTQFEFQISKIDIQKTKFCNHFNMKCVKCGSTHVQLKKLPCGHLLDIDCLEIILRSQEKNIFCKCPQCQKSLCQGYEKICNKKTIQLNKTQKKLNIKVKVTKSINSHRLPAIPNQLQYYQENHTIKNPIQDYFDFLKNKRFNKINRNNFQNKIRANLIQKLQS